LDFWNKAAGAESRLSHLPAFNWENSHSLPWLLHCEMEMRDEVGGNDFMKLLGLNT
jgi:hypothetical protein